MRKMKFKVGQRVWKFDENRRVYANSSGLSGPIFSKHFVPMKVARIEGRCYVFLGNDAFSDREIKVGFNSAEQLYLTDNERRTKIWLRDHSYSVAQLIHHCTDYKKLKQIADLLGYDATKSRK